MGLLEAALAGYSTLSTCEQIYLKARGWSCPLERVVGHIPATGSILDLGCGAGILARMAALKSPEARVLGVDPDPAKIRLAGKGASLPNLSYELREPALPRQGEAFDCICIVDVLYLMPLPAQRELLRRSAQALRPGGRLLVKCMDTGKRLKLAWERMQETLSVRLLHLTKGCVTEYAAPLETARWIRDDAGLEVAAVPIDRGYLHPHLLLIAGSECDEVA